MLIEIASGKASTSANNNGSGNEQEHERGQQIELAHSPHERTRFIFGPGHVVIPHRFCWIETLRLPDSDFALQFGRFAVHGHCQQSERVLVAGVCAHSYDDLRTRRVDAVIMGTSGRTKAHVPASSLLADNEC